MVDWYEVEFLYPCAFENFIKESFPNHGFVINEFLNFISNKDLFLFFKKRNFNFEIISDDNGLYYNLYKNSIIIQKSKYFKNNEKLNDDLFDSLFRIIETKSQNNMVDRMLLLIKRTLKRKQDLDTYLNIYDYIITLPNEKINKFITNKTLTIENDLENYKFILETLINEFILIEKLDYCVILDKKLKQIKNNEEHTNE